MKAYLIARVSTDEQSDALPGQIYRLKDYALRNKFDYKLFEIKESAYKGNRASFNKIITCAILESDPCVIVFDKIDRLTRKSISNDVERLYNLAIGGALELHFISDSLVLNKDSSSSQKFLFNVGLAGSQNYSDNISENVKRRNQQKRRDGEWCGKAPIGYINTQKPDGKKWIEQDPTSAGIVHEAFEMYASGTSSLREIARRWRETYGLKNTHSSRIDQVLKNPFYYGEMRVLGKLYSHRYAPLITRSLFEQAKAVRDGYKVKPHRWGGLPFPYRGLIDCATCGCRVTFETKKEKYTYGHCTRKKDKHPLKYVNENEITKQIQGLLRSVQIPDEAYLRITDTLRKSHEEKVQSYHKEMAILEAEITKYQQRKERVYEDYLDGKISEEFYEKKFDEFDTSLKLKQEARQSLELSDNDYYLSVSHLLKLAKDLPNLFEKAEIQDKRKLLKMVVSNLELDGDLLRWKYKKPFDTMAFCVENSTWLRQLGSNQRPNR